MQVTRLLLVLTLVACCAAGQPSCEEARANCEADCAAKSLVATSYLCRETPFGTVQSCTCGQSDQVQ